MFEHRMSQYRLFSIIGMTGKDISKIISTQVLICSSIGALLGILFGRVALYFINRIFWPAEFRLEVFKELGLNQHQLIELPPLNYLFLLFFTIVVINLFISSFVLSNLGILKAKSPSEFK